MDPISGLYNRQYLLAMNAYMEKKGYPNGIGIYFGAPHSHGMLVGILDQTKPNDAEIRFLSIPDIHSGERTRPTKLLRKDFWKWIGKTADHQDPLNGAKDYFPNRSAVFFILSAMGTPKGHLDSHCLHPMHSEAVLPSNI